MEEAPGTGPARKSPIRNIAGKLRAGRSTPSEAINQSGLRVRIGWKITAVVILVLFLLGAVNILFVRGRFDSVMNREFESKAMAIALTIAKVSEERLVSKDYGTIQSFADGYKDVHGVTYVYVQDAEGNLVAGVFQKGFDEKLEGGTIPTGEEEYRINRFRLDGVGDIVEVVVPVLFGRAGAVRVGMDHGLIKGEVALVTAGLVTQFAVASILGVILLHLVVIFLLRHMKTILGVLEKVKAGDLTARAAVTTRDEFDDLAAHLNSTVAHLSALIDRVDQSYESIFQANEKISRVHNDVREGMDQEDKLASETFESVTGSKKMTDEVTGGIHILENSTNDSFSSIMEMGASIEEVSSMADSLFTSVNESNMAVEELSRSIEQVSGNLASLSGAVEETAGAMNEMSASIVQVRGNAESTSDDAVQMLRLAEEGSEVSRKAREGMGAIKESAATVSSTMSLVSERIEEIDEILRFIVDITGRTNLLALNAAIIAAQAGAQGKGFGVVADEINELAQNTKAQTNRIAKVIEGLREEVALAAKAVEESDGKVTGGVQLTEEVTEALESIMSSTRLVSQKIGEIAQTTSEQADTSSRVLETTQRFSESVKNIKTLGEHQSAAGETLLQMSQQVQQAAQKVKTSTEEQAGTSQQINRDLTRITDTVRTISASTEMQASSGARVLRMTEDLSGIIRSNRETVGVLQEVISELTEHMEAMNRDLGIFRTLKSSDG